MRKALKVSGTLFIAALVLSGSILIYAKYENRRIKGLAQLIANDINNPEITTRFIENTLVLEGLASEEEIKRADSIGRAYLTEITVRGFLQRPEVLNLIVPKQVRPTGG